MSAGGRPPPGAPLSDHTAWHRRRHEEHARAEEKSRSGLRPKRRSFRPLPPGELAPTIKRHNDERAQRDLDAEMNRNAALEIVTACDFLHESFTACRPIEPSVIDMFQEAVREYLSASGVISTRPKGERIDAMHDAIASLLASLGR